MVYHVRLKNTIISISSHGSVKVKSSKTYFKVLNAFVGQDNVCEPSIFDLMPSIWRKYYRKSLVKTSLNKQFEMWK